MPANLPQAAVPTPIPYFRVIAFVAGGGVMLIVLLVLTRFLSFPS